MPNCQVPQCNGNFQAERKTIGPVSSFNLPKQDLKRREQWLKNISRDDLIPHLDQNFYVCERHFQEEFIKRIYKKEIDAEGKPVNGAFIRCTLQPDAVPTIFPNQPVYRTKIVHKRKDPEIRAQENEARKKAKIEEEKKLDSIANLKSISSNIKFIKEVANDNCGNFMFFQQPSSVVFLKLDHSNCPQVSISLKIMPDLKCLIFQGNTEILGILKTKLLGGSHKCDSFSKLKIILNNLQNFDMNKEMYNDQLDCLYQLIQRISENVSEKMESDPDFEDKKKGLQKKLFFLTEQIKMLNSMAPRYHTDSLLWACKLYFTFPAAYRMLRDFNLMALPHPSYLRRLLSSVSTLDGGLDDNHLKYMKERAASLTDQEKYVVLYLDEIYVKECLTYKGGKLVGSAVNQNDTARTIQVFMIKSMFSTNKEVVAMFPVKKLKAEELHKMTLAVLDALQKCGYRVISITSDNNKVNTSMFEMLCKGVIVPCIPNPVDPTSVLFILYDPVHVFKNVRNNWLNQPTQTFLIPMGTSDTSLKPASLCHLKALYDLEKGNVIKSLHGFSKKVLAPSSLERQQVNPVVKMFKDHVPVALLDHASKLAYPLDDIKSTSKFIEIIGDWWKVINCKSKLKGLHKRDDLQKPIEKDTWESCTQLEFLNNFVAWLELWESLSLPEDYKKQLSGCRRFGRLTKQTMHAIKHTTKTLIEIVKHCFNNIPGTEYVLLGLFQDDAIEHRFGKWRCMSGRNYNISVYQALESEKKIRFLDLLKIKSKSQGDFEIKSFCKSFGEDLLNSQAEIASNVYGQYKIVIDTCDKVKIPETSVSAMIFIAGYSAYAAGKNLKCSDCLHFLAYDRTLDIDIELPAEYAYLMRLDRGGLKVPTEFTVDIAIIVHKIFQAIVGGDLEQEFIRCNCQKALLMKLALEKFESLIIDFPLCHCGLDIIGLAKYCLPSLANIFLNSYSQIKNDDIERAKNERKMNALSGKNNK